MVMKSATSESPASDSPLVSIVVPCFEEKHTIGPCLDAILANDVPRYELEILVVDGMSQDGTREIINRYAETYAFIRLIDNPQKITPAALNRGIHASAGQYILILSGHILIDGQFIQHNINAIRSSGADCVGGIILTKSVKTSRMSFLITTVLTSRFAVGNSYFRVGVDKPRAVDTVPYGCYDRRVFENNNVFNEQLVRNQDLEFNLRIRQQGKNIVLIPQIKSYYYAPATLGAFLRQNFRNGYWVLKSLQFARNCFSVRHLVPLLFVTATLASLVLGLMYSPIIWLFYGIILLYVLVDIYFSIKLALEKKSLQVISFLFLFLLIHVAYGIGSAVGGAALLKGKIRHVSQLLMRK